MIDDVHIRIIENGYMVTWYEAGGHRREVFCASIEQVQAAVADGCRSCYRATEERYRRSPKDDA